MESKVYSCKLKTLSPVHIGSGKNYGPSEYVQAKAKQSGKIVKTIKRVDFAKFYKDLPDDKKDIFLMNLSNSNYRLQQDYPKISKEYTRYNCINKASSEPQDIIEHIKTSDKLYIPGSSIKGSIRTAIFYDFFDEEDLYDIKNVIRRGNRGPFIDRRGYNDFVDSFFSAPGRVNKAQKNIMRFIQIPDTTTTKLPAIYEILTVMAKQTGRMPDGTQYYSRRGNTVRSFMETIDEGKILKSDFTINYDEELLYKNNLSDKIGILDIDYLKEAIYKFSNDLIQYELDFADEYDISYLTKFYKQLDKDNTVDAPVLRIGAGSGFMATTLGMKIKDYDPRLFDEIRESTHGKTYDFEFPKSCKITKTGFPLSWVQLNFV